MISFRFCGNLIGIFFIECTAISARFSRSAIFSFFINKFFSFIFVSGVLRIISSRVIIGISLTIRFGWFVINLFLI